MIRLPCRQVTTNALRLLPQALAASRLSSSTNLSFASFSSVPLEEQQQNIRTVHQNGASHYPRKTATTTTTNVINPIPDFNNSKVAYESKTTLELLRAAACFHTCKYPILVNNAEYMLNTSRKVLGGTITDAILKASLFGHFCAGEDRQRIQPVLKKLENSGVLSILDYAAESDGDSSSSPKSSAPSPQLFVFGHDDDDSKLQQRQTTTTTTTTTTREYDYESEEQCDKHVETFKACINDVAKLSKEGGSKTDDDNNNNNGYAAIKVTALGNPKLLARMSQAIIEAKKLFAKFDYNRDGLISREEFERAYKMYFKDDGGNHMALKEIFEEFDPDGTGFVDYISWSMCLSPEKIPLLTKHCREIGPLARATPTEEEIELLEAMYQRGRDLGTEAAKVGTRLLIDAEQVRYQPAIDKLVLDLQQTYNSNSSKPIIYNTYQCYLKDAMDRLKLDVERAERFDYHFGAKLVRGAYMESERLWAEENNVESPIYNTIEETHDCYNDAVKFLLKCSTMTDKEIEVMVASHNQESIEKAIEVMNLYRIDRKASTICFAQLYGMSDNLSFSLGEHAYRAYKYVPYGEVHEVMPYLLRRARENSAIVGGAVHEESMIKAELRRRLWNYLPFPKRALAQ